MELFTAPAIPTRSSHNSDNGFQIRSSISIHLVLPSKLDERQTRSTFPTKNWRQRFGGLARRGTLAVETNNSRNLVISSPIKPLRPQPCSFARVEQYQSIGRCANDYLALSQLGTLRVHFFTLDNQKQKVGFAKIFPSLGSESFPHFFHDDF